jgi:hypothetical protein
MLEFAKELFSCGDNLSIECQNETIIGSLIKIDDRFVAIRTASGTIHVVKDGDIINIKSTSNQVHQSGSTFDSKQVIRPLTYEEIPWNFGQVPEEHMFKGRQQEISLLANHYLSPERDKPYILYGLTRTGKSTILRYLNLNNS